MANRIAPLVEVESSAGDRPELAPGAFQEGIIEVTRTVEEPVVSKRARVVEELVINKNGKPSAKWRDVRGPPPLRLPLK